MFISTLSDMVARTHKHIKWHFNFGSNHLFMTHSLCVAFPKNISIIIILFSAVKIARTYSCTTVGEQLHSIDTQRDDSICACEQRHM